MSEDKKSLCDMCEQLKTEGGPHLCVECWVSLHPVQRAIIRQLRAKVDQLQAKIDQLLAKGSGIEQEITIKIHQFKAQMEEEKTSGSASPQPSKSE